MDELTKKSLRKALAYNYWTVEKGLYYLVQVASTSAEKYYFQTGAAQSDITNGNFDAYARQTDKHNREIHEKIASRYDELKAFWHDTDHRANPRDKSLHPNDNHAEFPIRYFIEWALNRNIDIYWLNWARQERLVPADLPDSNCPVEDRETVLRRLLKRNYWSVDEGTAFLALSNTNLGGFEIPEKAHDEDSLQFFKLRIEYEELWFDTDHGVNPRTVTDLPHSGLAQYPVCYFIEWARSRDIPVPWLSWAIEQQLLPNLKDTTTEETLPFSVDWEKWGKVKKIELNAACGLLAGIDCEAFRFEQNKLTEWLPSELLEKFAAETYDRNFNAVIDRLTVKQKIDHVVHNHIKSGCFIETEAVEISLEQAIDSTPHGTLPEGATTAVCYYVNLPELGRWAKSNGYVLPPEFPVSAEKEDQKLSTKEKQKALEIVDGLKALNDDYNEIDESDIPSEIKRLMLKYYGNKPTQQQLMKDLSLKGIDISRPTLSKYFKLAFGV